MANRHKSQAKFNVGGALNAGGNPNVIKEAKQRKDGGKVAKHADGGAVAGYKDGGRLDKRARGGGVRKFASGGSDKNPYSSAHFKSGGAAKKD